MKKSPILLMFFLTALLAKPLIAQEDELGAWYIYINVMGLKAQIIF